MPSKPKVLIIYPYAWLAYAPTVVRLYQELSANCDVQVIAYEDESFCRASVDLPGVAYVRLPWFLARLTRRLAKRFPKGEKRWHFFHLARALHLYFVVRRYQPDEVLGSDYSGTWVAQRAFSASHARIHFLSLEIYDSDFFESRLRTDRLASAIVQTPVRFDRLFPSFKPKVFYIQNAPVFRRLPAVASGSRAGIVYCGTALPRFGIFPMLNFLRAFPEFRLTMQGLRNGYSEELIEPYNQLMVEGRLTLNTGYFESEKDLLAWLTQFKAGLCLYDFTYLPEDQFNYLTVPSGKVFNYLAAGVPVVGNNIPGLSVIREFNAGVLLDDQSPDSIAAAVKEVERNFEELSENCFRAAAHYSFDKAVEPFARFLLERHRAPEKPGDGPGGAF